MRFRALAIASVSVLFLVSPAGASTPQLVSPKVFAMATKVAICEEGGWSSRSDQHGPTYFGNLGWLDATWQTFRRHSDPVRMDYATPQEQARAMARFAGRYGWPDQPFCTGGY